MLVGVGVAVATMWLTLALALLWKRPDRVLLRDALSLPPDVIRLIRNLTADPQLPRAARWRLWVLLGYLVTPIDLVPDFMPVIGYADDVVLMSMLLAGAIRAAGADRVRACWTGSAAGLGVVMRLCRVDWHPDAPH